MEKKDIVEKKEDKMSIEEYQEKYFNMGMATGNSTEPANFKIADKAMMDLYEFCNLTKPKEIFHVDSPMGGQQLINQLKKQSKNTYNSTHSFGYGQHESYWIYTYLYYMDVHNVDVDDTARKGFEIMKELCDNSGFHYTYEDFAIICDRPEIIKLNDENIIHCDDGPAIKFSDGWTVYGIDGHRIHRWMIETPEKITPDAIQKEENAEISRIMIEMFGLGEYLIGCGAKVLDVDALGIDGSATRTLFEDKKGNKWLIGSDGSTERTYNMSVPVEVNTCKEAHNAICGFDESNIICES